MNPFKGAQKGPSPVSEMVLGTDNGVVLSRIPGSVREQMQYLWTRLQVHEGGIPQSIGVTSHISGEGVSFISQAMAATLARTSRTCLIETNWWSDGLPLPDTNRGLAGLMQGSASLNEVLVTTNYSRLSVLPAGEVPVSGPVIVPSTDEMRLVLNMLRPHFEHIVLDLPAISTSATALTFAAAASSSILVVRQRVTRTAQVEAAMADLRHTRLLGVVMNGNKISTPSIIRRRLVDV